MPLHAIWSVPNAPRHVKMVPASAEIPQRDPSSHHKNVFSSGTGIISVHWSSPKSDQRPS